MKSTRLTPPRWAAGKLLPQIAGLTALLLAPHVAHAAAVLTFYDDPESQRVVGVLTGSIDATTADKTDDNTVRSPSGFNSNVNGGTGILVIRRQEDEKYSRYALTPNDSYSSQTPWFSGSFSSTHNTDDQTISSVFDLNHYNYGGNPRLGLSEDSDSGESLYAYLVYNNESFESIGVTAGTTFGYSLTDAPDQTISITFSADAPPPPNPVPLPAAAPLLLGALGGFGLLSRRRKQRSTSAAACVPLAAK